MLLDLRRYLQMLILHCVFVTCVPNAHALFLQTPEDVVKQISLHDLAEFYTRPTYAIDQSTEKMRKKRIEENAISLKKQTGVDSRDSLFKILNNHRKARDLSVTSEREYEGIKTDNTDFEVINMSFKYKNASVNIYFLTTKKQMLKMQSATFLGIHKIYISNNEKKTNISGNDVLPLIVDIYSTSQK